jgi:cytochrome c oxidase subunit 2
MLFNLAFASTTPLPGSDVAVQWDSLYSFLVWISIFFFILVIGAMVYFIFTYPHRADKKTQYITGSHVLEAIWIVVPTLLLMIVFVWGYSVYHSMVQAPSDAYEIRVLGKQWLWTFQYEDGRTTVGEVFVPMHTPVKFIMTSEDVLHGFFVPNFRIKQDVVPGMYTSIWFTATVPGKHQVYCTEYCGTSHSAMMAQIVVLDEKQWLAWSRNQPLPPISKAGETGGSDEPPNKTAPAKLTPSLAEQGRVVYQNKGCVACHSTEDNTVKVGPSHKGLLGRKEELADGRIIVVDENHIRNHIENPQQNIVKGFNPVMPTFKGLITESEMNALITYIKSLK